MSSRVKIRLFSHFCSDTTTWEGQSPPCAPMVVSAYKYRVPLKFVYTLINFMTTFFMTENVSQKVMSYKVVRRDLRNNFVEHHFL
jgi:hypothetical protein